MRFLVILLLLPCLVVANDPPVLFPEPLSPRIANYNIQVKLLPKTRQLLGEEMILWRNTTEDPVYDLRFHLYLNGFRNNRSTFMRESGGTHRGNQIDATDGWGYTEIVSLRLKPVPNPVTDIPESVADPDTAENDREESADAPTLPKPLHPFDQPGWFSNVANHPDPADMEVRTATLRYLQPDDSNDDDKTYVMVPLDTPIQPGEAVWVQLSFRARLPQPPFARTGAWGNFFFIGQWFPKIAVWEDAGWTDHQFHHNTEFYADYGVYDVWMTVPEEHVLGATGTRVTVTGNGDGTRTHYYHAEDVHDFAWVSCPDFIEGTRQVQDVAVRALVHKSHQNQVDRHLDAAEVAVSFFQDTYGDYPFPNLTVVDPAPGAGGAGGMEYPTLITAGTTSHVPDGIRFLETVIIHEFGHNYWYHLLASNEFEEAWLDEGINSYTDAVIAHAVYGKESLVDYAGLKVDILEFHRALALQDLTKDTVVQHGWTFQDKSSYSTHAYAKPAMLLMTLHHYLGADTMREIMRTYVSRFRFKHPSTQDFIQVANEVSGRDLNWFFDQALHTARDLDYGVASVSSVIPESARGYDFTADAGVGTERPIEPKQYQNEVMVRRFGTFHFPVEVLLTFEDGSSQRKQWDGKDLRKVFTFSSKSRLAWAMVDPDHKISLDSNKLNNSLRVTPDNNAAKRKTGALLSALQLFLDVISF